VTASEADIEVVRRLFDRYLRGDYAGAAECLAEDVVYEVGQELPARGRAEVQAMWERWDSTWEGMETVPEEYEVVGDHVVAAVRYLGRGSGSGIEYEERLYDVYTFSAGRLVRKREFRSRAEALAAAGG
jgi:ketosteroid isomerase-like protein